MCTLHMHVWTVHMHVWTVHMHVWTVHMHVCTGVYTQTLPAPVVLMEYVQCTPCFQPHLHFYPSPPTAITQSCSDTRIAEGCIMAVNKYGIFLLNSKTKVCYEGIMWLLKAVWWLVG